MEQIIGRIDRRLVYAGLFLITLAPLVGRWALPLYVTPPPKMLADTINALPQDKLVFISSNWDAGTQAENRPQMTVLVRHLIRRRLKFASISIGAPNAPQLANAAIEQAIQLEKVPWVYGQDWVNLGYKLATEPWLRSFVRQIPEAVKEDWKGTPVDQIPVMRGVQKFGPDGQASMLIDITGSATIDGWYRYLSPTGVKLGLGCTAVMAPEQYPFLDSGQLSGLLTGMKGAAEYEQIIGAQGFGTTAMAGQSFAHLYILILIILGNLSLVLGWLERRRRRR
ncbi:MAG: hypothetical protein HY320_07910 [Armatimonadetes bacterium]|nr:hypothetical protein [Armatimonadota bacterium]